MSATVWTVPNNPVWYDGNDVGWDWTPAQYQQALQNGYETQSCLGVISQDNVGQNGSYSIVNYPASWVGVQVVPEPSVLGLTLAAGLTLLGGCRRCRHY
jgi:hypothetical protein